MIQIYSCHHKPYQQVESNIIYPIHVGKALSNIDLGFQGDDKSDNISNKNPHFCELTATYWIYKNSKADIVGLFHYRRFLNFANSETKTNKIEDKFASTYGITEENIKTILKDYDIIVPNKTKPTKTTVYDFYAKEHFGSDMDLVLDIIKQKNPSQQRAFNWRTEWDSNPRYPLGVHTISNRAPSASRSSVQLALFFIFILLYLQALFFIKSQDIR